MFGRLSGSFFTRLLMVAAVFSAGGCFLCGPDEDAGLAELRDPKGSVEVRQGPVEWKATNQGQVLHFRDAVRTGFDGTVLVEFKDGSQLQLKPKTLLQFTGKPDEYTISLQQDATESAAEVSAGPDVRVAVGGLKKTLRLTKGRAKFLRTADKLHASTSQGATLAFADGNQIRLGSKTALGLTSHEDEFKLLFEQGEIEISAEDKHAKGFKMIFGESTLVTMTIGKGTFTRTSDGVRIQMTMGSAIVTQDGKQTEIKAGASFLMRMGKVVITRREALPATLKDLKRISRIRKSGSRKFVRPKGKTSQIKPGTDIQVRKGGMVALLNAGSNRVELRSGARALFKGFYHSKVETDGEINLETGQARVKLRREANADTSQLIVTPQVVIKAVARGLTAETNVTSTKSYTQLVVHSGEAVATVGENHILVRAGQTLTVSKSGKIVGPNYLLKPGIRLLEGVSARVFYDRSVPPVAFTWKNQEKDGQAIY